VVVVVEQEEEDVCAAGPCLFSPESLQLSQSVYGLGCNNWCLPSRIRQ